MAGKAMWEMDEESNVMYIQFTKFTACASVSRKCSLCWIQPVKDMPSLEYSMINTHICHVDKKD